MKTTVKILSALIGLASIGAAVAQTPVYSQNVVGYVNVSFPAGLKLICNPVNGATNTVSGLFSISTTPDFTTIYKYNPTTKSYDEAHCYANQGWFDADENPVDFSLNPGEAAFVYTSVPFTNTFVGEVMQGSLTNKLNKGLTMAASQVPQSASPTTLGLTTALGSMDTVYLYRSGGWQSCYWVGTSVVPTGWVDADENPIDPQIQVAEGMFIQSAAGGNWVRSFSVGN